MVNQINKEEKAEMNRGVVQEKVLEKMIKPEENKTQIALKIIQSIPIPATGTGGNEHPPKAKRNFRSRLATNRTIMQSQQRHPYLKSEKP